MRKLSNAKRKDYFALEYGREMGNKSQILAIRNELKELRQEIRQEFRQEVGRLELKISETKADLIKEIGAVNVDMNKQVANLVKWVVGFGITIVLMFISLYLGK